MDNNIARKKPYLKVALDQFPLRKISIGSDWLSVRLIIHTTGPKKVENTSTLYHPGCGSQVQTGTENWYRKSMRGFNFVLIRSDPMLISLSGNRPSLAIFISDASGAECFFATLRKCYAAILIRHGAMLSKKSSQCPLRVFYKCSDGRVEQNASQSHNFSETTFSITWLCIRNCVARLNKNCLV